MGKPPLERRSDQLSYVPRLSFQQLGYMSHRMSDLRSSRSFRSVLPFRWFGLNFGHSGTPMDTKPDTNLCQKPTDVPVNAVYFAGAPTAGIRASGPSPFFCTKSAKTLACGGARHACFHFFRRDIF